MSCDTPMPKKNKADPRRLVMQETEEEKTPSVSAQKLKMKAKEAMKKTEEELKVMKIRLNSVKSKLLRVRASLESSEKAPNPNLRCKQFLQLQLKTVENAFAEYTQLHQRVFEADVGDEVREEAEVDYVTFEQRYEFPLLRTLDMRRSEDNEHRENMKYHTNTFRPEYASTTGAFESERKRFQDKYLIEQAREKFVEWDKRNTASSTVQSGIFSLDDYLPMSSQQLNKPLVSPLVTPSMPQSKPRRRYDLEYKTLVDESGSDSESEVVVPPQRRHPPKPNKQSSNSNGRSEHPVARPPNGEVYDKSLADLAPALHKIKLRRRAAVQKEIDANNASNANGHLPALNIMPAGFNLGNVQFANGNIILGSQEIDVAARSTVSSQKPRTVLSNQRPRPQKRYDHLDSSIEERMIRKVDMGSGTKPDDDEEEERW